MKKLLFVFTFLLISCSNKNDSVQEDLVNRAEEAAAKAEEARD